MNFVSLHHHSTFSFLDGFGTPESHAARIAELGMDSFALTEHGNVSSHVRLERAAQKEGVKPIFGVELYTGNVGEDAMQRKNHLTVIAENVSGYQNMLKVVSRGWSEGFYYEPTVSGEMLGDNSAGLIILSGCSGSLLSTSLVGGKNVDKKDASYERAKRVAARFRRAFGDSYYLEVQAFPELETTRNINKGLAELSKDLKIPLVATLDVHYTKPEENEMQMILHNVRGGGRQTLEDQARSWGYDVSLSPQISDKVILDRLINTGLSRKQAQEAVGNTRVISQRCNFSLPKIDALHYPLPEGYLDSKSLFRRWCEDGWKERGIHLKKDKKAYQERIRHEMKLIEDKDFIDYFLMISDAVKFAKRNGIPVGPARGSAAASLVCYVLRITEIDPIPFPNLLFDRFIDYNRADLPDIDLDFDDERRHEIRDYLASKYGADRVGNIGTWITYKGKNSLDDVARVYRIPKFEVDKVKELLIERTSGDVRASATLNDTVEQFQDARDVFKKYPELYKSMKLEGNLRGMSIHAAGIVVANEPLTNACAVYTRTQNGEMTEVISLDKYDAEYLNVLKIDVLGLKTMSMIRIALEQIGMELDELYGLPLDDEETIKGFQENDLVGIFQFDGRAMRSVNRDVKPNNFSEICDINALARPGPLHSGAARAYFETKHGVIKPKIFHPMITEVTKSTNYQIVYQEQILKIVREIGNFTWEEASTIRKIIAKSRGEAEINKMRTRFVDGAATHDISEANANAIYNMIATAGAYAFNAAHCVSYGMLAYWTMWLKRHHPQAFYVAALRKYDPKEKGPKILRDATKKGIKIKSPHLNRSELSWSADGEFIRAGFEQIKGIGHKTAIRILETRAEQGDFEDWDDLKKIPGIGDKTIQVIREFVDNPDPFDLELLEKKIVKVKKDIKKGKLGPKIPNPTHTSEQIDNQTDEKDECVWIGVVRVKNLQNLFEKYFSRNGKELDASTVSSPHLKEFISLVCEDDTGVIHITIDRFKYPKFKELVWSILTDKDLILVRANKRRFNTHRQIYATDIWVIDPEE